MDLICSIAGCPVGVESFTTNDAAPSPLLLSSTFVRWLRQVGQKIITTTTTTTKVAATLIIIIITVASASACGYQATKLTKTGGALLYKKPYQLDAMSLPQNLTLWWLNWNTSQSFLELSYLELSLWIDMSVVDYIAEK